MITLGWRAWAAAFIASIMIHGVLTIGLNAPTIGATGKPAGTPVSVSGSLASILGARQSNSVEAKATASEVNAAVAKEVDPTEVQTVVKSEEIVGIQRKLVNAAPVATQPQSVPSTPALEPVNAGAISARSVSDPPTAAAIEATPAEVITAVPSPATEVRERKSTEIPPNQRQEQQERRRKQEEQRGRDRSEKAEDRRKAAARAKAGSNRRGEAGTARGGRRGNSIASTGAINRYGAQVRSRILANRPSTRGAGRTVISFALSAGGGLRYARIARSSGDQRLDRAALTAVRRSTPFPRPPNGTNSRQLRFSISFSFQ